MFNVHGVKTFFSLFSGEYPAAMQHDSLPEGTLSAAATAAQHASDLLSILLLISLLAIDAWGMLRGDEGLLREAGDLLRGGGGRVRDYCLAVYRALKKRGIAERREFEHSILKQDELGNQLVLKKPVQNVGKSYAYILNVVGKEFDLRNFSVLYNKELLIYR